MADRRPLIVIPARFSAGALTLKIAISRGTVVSGSMSRTIPAMAARQSDRVCSASNVPSLSSCISLE